jgi:hypothetical protein
MVHARITILLAATAGILAACAQSPAGLERASSPAFATGEGVTGTAHGATVRPAAAADPDRAPGPAGHQHSH